MGEGKNKDSISEKAKYVREGRTERKWAKICMPGLGQKHLLWDMWEAIGMFNFYLISYSVMYIKHRCREGSGRPDRKCWSSSSMKGSWWDSRWSWEVEPMLSWLRSEQEWRSHVLLGTHISRIVQAWPWVPWWERVQEERTERDPRSSWFWEVRDSFFFLLHFPTTLIGLSSFAVIIYLMFVYAHECRLSNCTIENLPGPHFSLLTYE